jgi:hypothetical protein
LVSSVYAKRVTKTKISMLVPQGSGGVRDFADCMAEKLSARLCVVVIPWSKSNCDEVWTIILESECVLEDSVRFKHDGIWSEGKLILVGDRVFIGRNCEFIFG